MNNQRRGPAPAVTYGFGEDLSLTLRRYSLPYLFNGHEPRVTAGAVALAAGTGYTVLSFGLFATLASVLAFAVIVVGIFLRLRGNVRRPRAARSQAQRIVTAVHRNWATPLLSAFFEHKIVAFVLVTVVAEISNWIGNDAVAMPLVVLLASAALIASRDRRFVGRVNTALHRLTDRLPFAVGRR